MPLLQNNDFVKLQFQKFIEAIEPFSDAYKNDSFSYIAIKAQDGLTLIQGSIFLNVRKLTIPLKVVNTTRVQAGHFRLDAVGLTRVEAITQLLDGKLTTPWGELKFPPNRDSGRYGTEYKPYHELGLGTQTRLTHLAILGADTSHYLEQPDLDWDLRAAQTPYDGVQDLLTEFQPGILRGTNCVEIAAFQVASIDANSAVSDETASLRVRAAITSSHDKISVGIRIIEKSKVIHRTIILTDQFKWENFEDHKLGVAHFNVPKAAIVHGIANYNGVAQHHYYFGDKNSFQNPRRGGYEAFDTDLNMIKETLLKTQNMRDSRDFEVAMTLLFWILGFSAAHLGALSKANDAPDFIGLTPQGNFIIVECTIGLLKGTDKLRKLYERVLSVRRKLAASNYQHIRVLPIMITAKLAEEVRPDIEQAEKLGVYVATREGIDDLLRRTLFPQNVDQLYEEAERVVSTAQFSRMV